MQTPPWPPVRTRSLVVAAGALVAVPVVGVLLALTAFSSVPNGHARLTAPQAEAVPANALVNTGFEDGTQGWKAQGGGQVRPSTTAAHGGRHSMLVTGKDGKRPGASLDLAGKLRPGTVYGVSVWLRLPAHDPGAKLRLGMSWGWASAVQDTVLTSADVTADGWVRLEAKYTPVTAVDVLTADISPVSGDGEFHVDDFTVVPLPDRPQVTVPSLKEAFGASFEIGAAVGQQQLAGMEADLLKRQFGSVTPTNALKWTATEPQPQAYRFAAADAIVDFATANGMKVRGHTLVWHNQTPDWVFLDPAGKPMTPTAENKALLLQRMESHIAAVVGQYRGRIQTWDVVNEVIADDGTMRASRWYQLAGLDFIKRAFQAARIADPAAKLCVNDFNLSQPTRRDAMYQLVSTLKAEGVPIDCIGDQTHVNIAAPTAAQVSAALEKFARLGIDQQVTELDVSVYTDNTSVYTTVQPALLARQAAQYQALFGVYLKHRDKISSVTFWGLADNDSWLHTYPIPRTNAPLLFDAGLAPKPAFWAVVGDRPAN
ncbi:endo-1,4-beta-xylanase [Dactylosporangium sp. NPDC005555]|uniref:endo-1,4-beta-xylanase n=1 Tax=Dactylosporangium sp. NPDC005555 TaxID=3154889 RepID=UPI0033AF4F05